VNLGRQSWLVSVLHYWGLAEGAIMQRLCNVTGGAG
jgi:hypothetical protein